MCMKAPKMSGGAKTPSIPTQPIQESQAPTTQSGADTANKKRQGKPASGSLFQIDLTIPSMTGAGTSAAGTQDGGVGASVR
jgi:hypothetical protein